MDIQKILTMLEIAAITGAMTTLFVQKIKCHVIMEKPCVVVLISFVVSMALGILFSITFYNLSLVYSLWVGLFTFVGAEAIYKVLKDVLKLKTISDLQNETPTDPVNETEGEG